MQEFVSNLVGVSERVRQRPPEVRKFYLRKYLSDLLVPPLAVVPSTQSLDKFRYILKLQPCESSVGFFATGSPCYVVCETEQHLNGLDVATFMGKELQEYSEEHIRAAAQPPITDLMLDRPSAEDDGTIEQYMILSSMLDVIVRPYWKADGSAMDGLDERFVTPTARNKGRESILPPMPDTLAPKDDTVTRPKSQICNTFMLRLREFETQKIKATRMRNGSPAGHLLNWNLSGLTALSNVDARQEALIAQIITYYAKAFANAGLPVWMQCSRSVPVSKNAVISDLTANAYSLDSIKQHCDYPGSLAVYFEKAFGGSSDAPQYKIAVDNFVGSMAAYSIICYLLGIRGRNDNTIMLDNVGHIIHNDFSSVFKAAPVSAFHSPINTDAPFSLTPEMVAVMGGRFSPEFAKYATLCGQCLVEARRHFSTVNALLEISSDCSDLAAIKTSLLTEFRARHIPATPDFSGL